MKDNLRIRTNAGRELEGIKLNIHIENQVCESSRTSNLHPHL